MAHVATRDHGEALPEVLIEERRLGAWLKIAAVDPRSGEEAVAIGPANNPGSVRQAAIGKLKRRLAGR
ncbi:DUF6898 family protein [Elioraea sp.]|uniref:DUF6898 family protein n=1 Tax=Elioraea sp. TaxID=2185103 RepID=UPI0025C1F1EA|nr:hypothetical protein [Elioraea sp.]